MRVVLVANPQKDDAVGASRRLANLLAPRATVVELIEPTPDSLAAARPDMIVVLGGDGTILRVAQAIGELDAPVVGINFGKLGYLTSYQLDEFVAHADDILARRVPITQRLMLEGTAYRNVCGPDETITPDALAALPSAYRHRALNDIVINAGEPFRMIDLYLSVNGQETTTFRGDGLVVSTSSGSTGYSLSAGGPLITPDVHALVLTPICAHSLSFRPVVVSDTATIVVHPRRINPGSRVIFDGLNPQPLCERDALVVRRAPRALQLVEHPHMSHWKRLAGKLNWAQSPRQ